MSQGQLFVISAPSGAGKTSLVAATIARVGDLAVSVSPYHPEAHAPMMSMVVTTTLSNNQSSSV